MTAEDGHPLDAREESRQAVLAPAPRFEVALLSLAMADSKTAYLVCGTLLALAGLTSCVVFALQPWRSCPEIDDSAAGCPATPADSLFLVLSFFILLVGAVLLVRGLMLRRLPPGW